MTFVILGCALPAYKVWWPFLVVLFYILSPLPTLIARRYSENATSNNQYMELAIFLTMGCVISSFALPIVLSRSPESNPTIKPGACYLTIAGNFVMYSTILGFFLAFDHDESEYSMW
uniref:Leptin receptor overlapping transcript-like 1 n=1 Tax=Trichogramma kaykai TaxID=54128 RepID=A0ABD2W986_9HYME